MLLLITTGTQRAQNRFQGEKLQELLFELIWRVIQTIL